MTSIAKALSLLCYLNQQDRLVGIKELADYLDVSQRQVRRYRADLEEAGFIIQSSSGPGGGYQLTRPLPSWLGQTQLQTLLLNLSIRNNQLVIGGFNAAVNQVTKLTKGLISGDNNIDDQTLYKLVAIAPWLTTNLLTITYVDGDDRHGVYLVKPLRLRIKRNKYYLVALHQETLKQYRIDRIADVEVSERTFIADQEVLRKIDRQKASGVAIGDDLVDVEILVNNDKVDRVIANFIDGGLVLVGPRHYRFKAHPKEVIHSLLALGDAISVLSPPEVVARYQARVRAMWENL